MSQRRHAAPESSFARSAGGAAGRGLVLVIVAVLIGVFLLREGFDGDTTVSVGPEGTTGTTTSAETTVAPPGTDPATTDPAATSAETTATPATHPANEVKVLIANATNVNGAARNMAGVLNPLSYVTVAETARPDLEVATTSVHYVPGYEADAAAVAAAIGANPQAIGPIPDPPPVADLQGSHVVVILGADLARSG